MNSPFYYVCRPCFTVYRDTVSRISISIRLVFQYARDCPPLLFHLLRLPLLRVSHGRSARYGAVASGFPLGRRVEKIEARRNRTFLLRVHALRRPSFPSKQGRRYNSDLNKLWGSMAERGNRLPQAYGYGLYDHGPYIPTGEAGAGKRSTARHNPDLRLHETRRVQISAFVPKCLSPIRISVTRPMFSIPFPMFAPPLANSRIFPQCSKW